MKTIFYNDPIIAPISDFVCGKTQIAIDVLALYFLPGFERTKINTRLF